MLTIWMTKDVLGGLLEVLDRINGRLKSIESSIVTTQAAAPEQVEDVTALHRAGHGHPVLAGSADLLEGKHDLDETEPAAKQVIVSTSKHIDRNSDQRAD